MMKTVSMRLALTGAVLALAAPASTAQAATTPPKTISVYVGTAVVTAIACAGSTDKVGTVYAIAYRDKSSVVDFTLLASKTEAKGFASTSATAAEMVTLNADGTISAGTVSYSGFALTALSSTEDKMTITVASSSSCSESYRAVMTLTKLTD